ncbi:MAG: S53 family peptidase [Chloroflexi bacterium]|nr:S53 family peptidase [Ktedonobacteraceae bacterium]MBV9020314.1 S53 family peptidase [Ktedonobacteraceae bacterium]MBV9708496.1 S53 family peptidase [Chloroflexota bacterium]
MKQKVIPVLVLVVLFALCSPAISAFAKEADGQAAGFHPYFRVHKFSGLVPDANGGLSANQLRKAYGVDQLTSLGQGVTIAIVDAYGNPNAQADLNQYDATYGLPATTITVVYPQGRPQTVNSGWALESDLDLQMAHAIAPRAHLVLEAAKSASSSNIFAAIQDAYTNHGATIVSMSFGSGEFSSETSTDSTFANGNKAGVSFTAASGDNGHGAQYPAASPFVTAVGGTTLKVQSDGTYVSETAWSGSGGGISAIEKRPSFQNGFNNQSGRGIPDVAMVGDPNTGVSIYDSFGYQGQKGFFIVGGTSVSTPLFAGILALADASRSSSMKNADIEIYNVAGSHYATDFHDITSGSNGGCGSVCSAHSGYDFVTGLGSPVANKLVPDLAAAP